MEKSHDDKAIALITQWLDGQLSEEALREQVPPEQLAEWKGLLKSVDNLEAPPFDEASEWESLSAKRHKTQPSKAESPKIAKRRRLLPLLRVAGIAAGFIALFFCWKILTDPVLQLTTYGEEQAFHRFPEGSVVHLSAASRLTYDKRGWAADRKMKLKGIAYFDVSKGSPFVIDAQGWEVEVLGTRFDVYAIDGLLKVRCYEGKVAVRKGGEERILEEGMGVRWEKTQAAPEEIPTQAGEQPAWLKGQSEYNEAALIRVLDDIGRHFDYQIEWPEELAKRTYTGAFPHTTIEQALNMVCIPMSLKPTIDKGKRRVRIEIIRSE